MSILFMQQKVIYPGTFDPLTNGHLDLIQRAAKIFPEVIVAVSMHQSKRPWFSGLERFAMVEQSVVDIPGVLVKPFDGLLVDFLQAENARIILRGLRAVSDFEYEFQLAGMNRKLSKNIETVFLTPSDNALYISSSFVREISSLGGDVSEFVPDHVNLALIKFSME